MSNILDMALLKNSVLVKLDLRSWGNQRKAALPKSAVEDIIGKPVGLASLPMPSEAEKEERLKKAQAMLKLSKALVVSPEFEAIKSFQAQAKQRVLQRYCNPSFIDEGLFSVKRKVKLPDGREIDLVGEMVKELELAKAELEKVYVPKFLEKYPEQVAAAADVLNGQFNPSDYPGIDLENGVPVFKDKEALAKRFDIRWRVTQLTVPEGLSPEIREAEEAKLRASFEAAEKKIVETLYTGLATMVNHIIERMKPEGVDEKKKVFHYTILENLMDYITSFRNKNVFNDEKLAGMVDRAEEILKSIGTDPQTMAKRLRDYEGLKKSTVDQFRDLKDKVDAAISELPSRTFDFSDSD